MSSIAKPTTRSKKTKRLGPVRVIRPDQYEAFDVDRKLECIRALIPLGLMHVQEVLEEEVYQWAGGRGMHRKPLSSWAGAMAVIPVGCRWRATAPPADSAGAA